MMNMRDQSERYGTEIITETVDEIDLSSRPFKMTANGVEYLASSVIIATGATAKRLNYLVKTNTGKMVYQPVLFAMELCQFSVKNLCCSWWW